MKWPSWVICKMKRSKLDIWLMLITLSLMSGSSDVHSLVVHKTRSASAALSYRGHFPQTSGGFFGEAFDG